MSPSPAQRRQTVVNVAVVVGVVWLLLVCVGVGGLVVVLRSQDDAASSSASSPVVSGSSRPGATASPHESAEPATQGPEASDYPAEDILDLDRVCDDNVYYPQSPKRAGKAPHPVVVLVADDPGLRYQNSGYYYSQGLSKTAEQTWAARDPAKVQMVACLDRVSSGAKIRTCEYDDPKPDTAALLRAGWRLRVYEVATGRKLLDKRMSGDDQKCPLVVLLKPDKKIHATVSDRALIHALRPLVTR